MSLTNTQYNEIIRKYQQRQLSNRYLMEDRASEIAEKIPEIESIHHQITQISMDNAKKLISGVPVAPETLRIAINDLHKKKKQLLESYGYSSDYLDPIYTCTKCKDTGFINGSKCSCFKQAEYALVFSQSHLIDDLKDFHFQNFSLDYYSEAEIDENSSTSYYDLAAIALETCEDFARLFSNEFKNLFLYGSVGIGKTFLSNCIANSVLNQGYSVLYLTAFSLFDTFQKSVFDKQPQAKEEAQHILDCDLLIIDDLGTEFANSFTTSQFFMCINERLLTKKSTIISSNLELNQIAALYSERTSSRIALHYELLKLCGKDIRLAKRYGKN